MGIIRQIWQFLRESWPRTFPWGIVLGASGFAAVTFLFFLMRWWWGEVMALFQPQAGQTPANAVGKSCLVVLVGFAFVILVLNDLRGGTVIPFLWRMMLRFARLMLQMLSPES